MDSLKSYELLQIVKELAKSAVKVQNTLDRSFLREQVIEVVEGYYNVGKVIQAFEVLGGYTNRSFQVIVDQGGERKEFFLRKYKKSTVEREIRFEHQMIHYIQENGFDLLAGLIANKEGETFVRPVISNSIFALYNFLEGEDKYTWDNPIMEESEYASAAEVLASFHNASIGFESSDLWRTEPGIVDLTAQLPHVLGQFAREDRNSKLHDYYRNVLPNALVFLNTLAIPEEDWPMMVKNPIHCDFHPGNMKFKGGKVVGLFDLDWAKIDFRLFDICLALIYNSSSWGGKDDGTMLLEKCRLFLDSYQQKLTTMGKLSPLNRTELDYFPIMMAMANFYLINWEVSAYYQGEEKNDYEYLAYLKHSIRQMHWIENNTQELAAIADSARIYV